MNVCVNGDGSIYYQKKVLDLVLLRLTQIKLQITNFKLHGEGGKTSEITSCVILCNVKELELEEKHAKLS